MTKYEEEMIKIKKVVAVGVLSIVGTILLILVSNFKVAMADDELSDQITIVTNEDIDIDKVCSLLEADNYVDVSCGASNEAIIAAKEICEEPTIECVVSSYVKADNNYIKRLYKRYGEEILK